jgi:serine/threonine-protein kinase
MYDAVASGGMATVHLGCLTGAAGFTRIVAIKALRPQYAEDADFVSMFIDEARVASRIHHPNVVPTLDVITKAGELYTVMEYVHGETLSRLIRAGGAIAPPIVSAIVRDVLLGLHAAHEATDEKGDSLNVVHRDVSPQNVIVGVDGIARVLDFGVAKAAGRVQTTREGQVKGKLAYMAPEQLQGNVTPRADIFAVGVLLWEALVGERMFKGTETEIVFKVLQAPSEPPSKVKEGVPEAIDAIALRALAKKPEERFENAREMADALVAACPPASSTEVGAWVSMQAAKVLEDRRTLVREIESSANVLPEKAEAVTVVTPPEKQKRGRVVMFAVAGVVALAVLGTIAVLAFGNTKHETAQTPAPTTSASATVVVTASAPVPTISAAPTMSAAPAIRVVTPATATARPKATAKPTVTATTPDHI